MKDTPIWQQTSLPMTATLRDTIANLNETGVKLVLCLRDDGRLFGTVSDGDLRRGMLRGLSMEALITEVANQTPFVVSEDTDRAEVRAIMQANGVMHVPIVDRQGCVVGLHLWNELDQVVRHDHPMVIMAGGMGTRLRPYTDTCPKPLLEVAGKPMLQHIIERAQGQGFGRFVISLNYLGDMIRDFFGDGSRFGVTIDYVTEDAPLGTAGALSLLDPRPALPFVVTNGDVLTDVNYWDLIDFCSRHEAKAVMAVKVHEWTNPYGVVEMDGLDITGFTEKPVIRSHINAGVYALQPSALDLLSRGASCNMPTLFDRLRDIGSRTVAYPMHEPWLDVGRPHDLELANREESAKS